MTAARGGIGVLLAITFVWGAAQAAAENSLAMAIKATFLYKFPLYVTWPERAFPAATSPFTLCIVGDDAFAALVERAARGQSIAEHAMSVLRLRTPSQGTPAPADQCRVLYIATDDPLAARQLLAGADGMPVLTVTDGMTDPAAKGMVNFVIAADRVRFEIDEAAAVRSGLSVSSKLLSLAVSVRPAQ